ncbi:MAG: mismatch-specific DNA-glycosylase [Pseudomonadota bacterium]|nr:mismatch-specific DNA-glycosylase [Pseudomonadota bacterium]
MVSRARHRPTPSHHVTSASADLLPDLLVPDLDLVFCGTAAGKASAAAGAYYAHPQNRFWQALHESGLTERRFAPAEFPALLDVGLGLTDLAKKVFGNDDELGRGHFDVDGLVAKIEHFRPGILAFTSKAAAKAFLHVGAVDYGLQDRSVGGTRLFVLPSPSGAASGHWSLEPWRQLAGLRKACR